LDSPESRFRSHLFHYIHRQVNRHRHDFTISDPIKKLSAFLSGISHRLSTECLQHFTGIFFPGILPLIAISGRGGSGGLFRSGTWNMFRKPRFFPRHFHRSGIGNHFRDSPHDFLNIIRSPQKCQTDIFPRPPSTAQQRKENLNKMVESAFRATMSTRNFIPEGSKLFEIPLL
jgi:hypothetical protein